MTGKDELRNFKKMWTWLMAYPAHDREYYMKHVAKLDAPWHNSCPLSEGASVGDCNGCKSLWDSSQGTLCTDPGAPLSKWEKTERDLAETRSLYASQVAVLAMKAGRHATRRVVRRKAAS